MSAGMGAKEDSERVQSTGRSTDANHRKIEHLGLVEVAIISLDPVAEVRWQVPWVRQGAPM